MQQLQLSIPEPCHQNWSEMSPNEQGRFCNSCAKTVVDFSIMTDAQLILYFENLKNENVCGRVYPDQLDRSIKAQPLPRKKIFAYWQYLLAFFIMLGKGQQARAQGEIKPKVTVQPDTLQKPIAIRLGGIRRHPLPPDTRSIGTALPFYFITDEKNQPVPNASVQMLPKGDWIVSDSTGKINLGKNHKVESLVISAVGFDETIIILKDMVGNNMQLVRTQKSLEAVCVKSNVDLRSVHPIAGGISYIRTETLRANLKDSVANIFASGPSLQLFPSQVAKGSSFNIITQLKESGKYNLQVADAAGKVLLQQPCLTNEKKLTHKISVPSTWNAGIYFVSVISEQGKIIGTEKLVIE